MSPRTSYPGLRAGMLGLVAGGLLLAASAAAQQQQDGAQQWEELFALTRPQPDEWIWAAIEWETRLSTARKRAADEGKPLFIMGGAGANALGLC